MIQLLHNKAKDFKHFHVWIVFAVLFAHPVSSLYAQGSTNNFQQARTTAVQYCGGCHQFPEPGMLDRNTWTTRVLPMMGWRLGIHGPDNDPYADLDPTEKARVESLRIYPEKPLISQQQWSSIIDYFKKTAPANLKLPEPGAEKMLDDRQFDIIPLTLEDVAVPSVSMLEFDTVHQHLYVGDAKNKLFQLGKNLETQNRWDLSGPPADMAFPLSNSPRLLLVGSIAPTEERNGVLFDLMNRSDSGTIHPPIIGMARPVHVSLGDIDGDGMQDALVCEFGHHTGQLTLFPGQQPENAEILISRPGARQTILRDVDKDGRMDIIAMMAQAQEQVVLLKNMGEGKFGIKVLLNFSPLHGLSHMELKDMDGDGDEDLLMSNGDNWDFSNIRKPYHGVRIFLNDGTFKFRQGAFFPLPGASKAMAADFDGDGDQDIAAISFYDDPVDPIHGFLLLENKGEMQFDRHLLPAARSGKWLTMECADIDQDGRTDIILGSYFHNPLEATKLTLKGITDFPQLLILKNRWKRP